ncbi:hypothetical protein Micbo1qcDRAFT_165906, partial [Microdochium bolleyi]
MPDSWNFSHLEEACPHASSQHWQTISQLPIPSQAVSSSSHFFQASTMSRSAFAAPSRSSLYPSLSNLLIARAYQSSSTFSIIGTTLSTHACLSSRSACVFRLPPTRICERDGKQPESSAMRTRCRPALLRPCGYGTVAATRSSVMPWFSSSTPRKRSCQARRAGVLGAMDMSVSTSASRMATIPSDDEVVVSVLCDFFAIACMWFTAPGLASGGRWLMTWWHETTSKRNFGESLVWLSLFLVWPSLPSRISAGSFETASASPATSPCVKTTF